jgi:glycosyltransferase involved in cell wall biosynthesis
MRIIITVENFNPNSGYLESYLAKELSNLGHKTYIFTFNRGKKISRRVFKESYEVIRIPYMGTIAGTFHVPTLNGIAYAIRFIKTEKPDVVHCQPLTSPLSIFFLSFKNIFGYKIVGSIITQLNIVFLHWNLMKKILFCLSKIIIENYTEKRTQLFFAKTNELVKILSRSYGIAQNKFCIIPLGADPELFKFNHKSRTFIRKKLGLSENDVVIVYSGKINSSKRLHVLIKALSSIIKSDHKVKLLIIGKGDVHYVGFLKKLISDLKIADNIIFHPWVERTTLNAFYSASDIGVWPGLSSTSIVDAASSSLPLIIARYPVETYAVGNGNGFTFEIDNVEELRRYLEILIYDDKLRKKMCRKSRELVEQKLNWKAITMRYLEAYTLALNPPQHKDSFFYPTNSTSNNLLDRQNA